MVIMSQAKTSKSARQNRITKVITGLETYFANAQLTLGGVVYAIANLTKLLQGDIDASSATALSRAQLSAAVKAEHDSHQKVDPLLRFIKSFVIAQFGDSEDAAPKLAAFGYTPRKARSKDVKVKAEAADKALATRKARNTVGPKVKAKIKGTPPNGAPATGPAKPTA
jgi:hypothetical protein